MSTNKKTNKKGKKTIGGMITTVLATIIVIIAYLFGWGGEDSEDISENAVNHASDSQVVSEEYDIGEQADAGEEETVISEEVQEEDETSVFEEEDDAYTEEKPDVSEPVDGDEESDAIQEVTVAEITFRNQNLLDQHYDKHGIEMGFASAQEYELAAYKVTIHPDTLHKIEAEDGDDVYYREETNEFVVVSQDGYIRTYFNPSGGIDYYNRQ